MRNALRYAVVALWGPAAFLAGCREPEPEPPLTTADVVIASADAIPLDPSEGAWNDAPEHLASLITQDLVDPRQMEPTTGELRVRALSDGTAIAFRLQWADDTQNDLLTTATFADACAVQLPAEIGPTLPAPQMGEEGRMVEITYWSAAWQASVDGRGDSITDLYPNASIDHYPFEAQSLEPGSQEQRAMEARYAPAMALGNPMSGPHSTPVQNLVAEGPGTLAPAPSAACDGHGLHTEDGWAVVITRQMPQGLLEQSHSQVAFAVWEGSHKEVGARKMRTGWITLTMQEKP
ncbi:MAG: ethylbenzene dehydrogenase-related protein [Planctomycetota bacterium]|jgi:hypothetical protein